MPHDELMDDVSTFYEKASAEAFFQFGENQPIKFATVYGGDTFSIILDGSEKDSPEINFTDGAGNHFKIYLKKCS